jgi:hypothetical protein
VFGFVGRVYAPALLVRQEGVNSACSVQCRVLSMQALPEPMAVPQSDRFWIYRRRRQHVHSRASRLSFSTAVPPVSSWLLLFFFPLYPIPCPSLKFTRLLCLCVVLNTLVFVPVPKYKVRSVDGSEAIVSCDTPLLRYSLDRRPVRDYHRPMGSSIAINC